MFSFAKVILPIPVHEIFTYRIPEHLRETIQVGMRVVVPLGNRKILTGIVYELLVEKQGTFQTKEIFELLDNEALINSYQFKIWEWVAQYYMCSLGEVMNAALPTGFKLNSESKIQLNPSYELNADIALNDQEFALVEVLKTQQSLSFEQIADILQKKTIYPILKNLLAKEVILIFEEVTEKYKPKIVKKVRLLPYYANEQNLSEVLDFVKKSPKQEQLILRYLSLISINDLEKKNQEGVKKADLIENNSESSLKTLIKYHIFEEFEQIVSRFESSIQTLQEVRLSDYQENVVNEILEKFEQKNTILLHGVTGSGKTEMYIQLIQKVIGNGQQVLFLLPEIALTTQIVVRLQKIFGSQMGVYHSRFSDNERVDIYKNIQKNAYSFVVGVRSAVWLPFDNLGLIIVDEEHDASYKQHDPAPRYHARDLSMVLANLHQCKVLLGSATPSCESYYLAQNNFYGLVKAEQRFGNAQLPDIQLVDLHFARKMKAMKSQYATEILDTVARRLEVKEQIIVFQNRRGYAPQLNCQDCDWIPKCENCSVSLTYHRHKNELRCHYCGYHEQAPSQCAVCSSKQLKMVGYGTEKIEEELQVFFPESAIQRMDLDTTRSKSAYHQIIENFSQHKIDILVGTQMVTKGLDFDGVNLVCVFDLDRLLHFPDFRSFERVFQLLTQVSGRAGRRNNKGLVMVQTSNPQHQVLQKVVQNDFLGFYESEIVEREKYFYPPFCRLIRLTVKHQDLAVVEESAKQLVHILQHSLGSQRILGPESPIIERIRNQFLKTITIKLERQKIDLVKVKKFISDSIGKVQDIQTYKRVQIVIDVDAI